MGQHTVLEERHSEGSLTPLGEMLSGVKFLQVFSCTFLLSRLLLVAPMFLVLQEWEFQFLSFLRLLLLHVFSNRLVSATFCRGHAVLQARYCPRQHVSVSYKFSGKERCKDLYFKLVIQHQVSSPEIISSNTKHTQQVVLMHT